MAFFHGGGSKGAADDVYGVLLQSFVPDVSIPRMQCRKDMEACVSSTQEAFLLSPALSCAPISSPPCVRVLSWTT